MDRAGTVRVLAMGVLVLALVLSGCANPTGSSGGGGDGDDGSGGGGGQPFTGIIVTSDTDIVGTRFEENRAGLRETNVIESYLVGVSGG